MPQPCHLRAQHVGAATPCSTQVLPPATRWHYNYFPWHRNYFSLHAISTAPEIGIPHSTSSTTSHQVALDDVIWCFQDAFCKTRCPLTSPVPSPATRWWWKMSSGISQMSSATRDVLSLLQFYHQPPDGTGLCPLVYQNTFVRSKYGCISHACNKQMQPVMSTAASNAACCYSSERQQVAIPFARFMRNIRGGGHRHMPTLCCCSWFCECWREKALSGKCLPKPLGSGCHSTLPSREGLRKLMLWDADAMVQVWTDT